MYFTFSITITLTRSTRVLLLVLESALLDVVPFLSAMIANPILLDIVRRTRLLEILLLGFQIVFPTIPRIRSLIWNINMIDLRAIQQFISATILTLDLKMSNELFYGIGLRRMQDLLSVIIP